LANTLPRRDVRYVEVGTKVGCGQSTITQLLHPGHMDLSLNQRAEPGIIKST